MITSLYEHTDYFPDEAFDPDVTEEPDGAELANSHALFVDRLRRDAREVVGDDREHFTKEEELLLARRIQAGLKADGVRGKQGATYDGSLDGVIADGLEAKRRLVIANLPYTAYFAGASMGQQYNRNDATVPGIPRPNNEYLGHLKEIGAWAPVAQLASPRADLEDRTMVAIEAMWEAADKYKPTGGDPKKKARFITFATWHMHGALQRHAVTEVSGWDTSHYVLTDYLKEMKNSSRQAGSAPEGYHIVDGVYHFKLPSEQVVNGRQSVSLEDVTATAPDEADHFGEPIPLQIDDLVADQGVDVFRDVERQELKVQLARVLNTLSAEEGTILRMRYGLEDGRPKDLRDIARQLKENIVSVRQIESKAMTKVRHGTRSEQLRVYTESDILQMPPGTMEPHAEGTTQLRTRRVTEENPE